MSLKIIVPLLLFAFFSYPMQGQKEVRKADRLLSLKAFELAIKNYESALIKDKDNAEIYARLGEAYRMTNQLLKSLKAYERAFELSPDLDGHYVVQYGHTLKRVGLYEQAQSWYGKYMVHDAPQASHFISSTDFAKLLLQEEDEYDIISFDHNSTESDFASTFYGDRIVFASFREDMARNVDKKNDSYIQSRGNQLFITDANSQKEEVIFLRPDHKELYNIAPVTYVPQRKLMAYSRNSFTHASNVIFEDDMDMKIYLAQTNESGDFFDVEPFPYNHVEYSCGFPNLAYNGSAIYFASNKPGGYGGFDIYVSYLKDEQWTYPENLGEEVNSKGNEISPYFDGERLYFASDYHMGLGGFDNFVSEVLAGQWAQVENLGKGINSPADDYYLHVSQTDQRMYFSSNRLGGMGKDDIYIAYPIDGGESPLAYEEAPPAIDLDALSALNSGRKDDDLARVDNSSNEGENSGQVLPVSEGERVEILEGEETSFSDKVTLEDIYFDFEGATFLSREEGKDKVLDENAEVFFVQLASLSRSEGKLGYYSDIISMGNLYRFFKANTVKIRLGYYKSRAEAEDVLPKVKSAGFEDAFVTSDVLGISEYELLKANDVSNTEKFINEYSPESQYKVKLASYLNPMSFNVESARGIGRLEQWTKGKWQIFVLGGFESFEDAEKARIRSVNRGFTDAELVLDDGGILRRIKSR